jgi:GrpB-like predicted nucleotidyltransferase (UPF0157 family)
MSGARRLKGSLREECANVKRQLAETTDVGATYVEAKSALLSRVLQLAGLNDQERATIAIENCSG